MKKKFTLLMMLAFLGLNIGALRAQGTTNWGGSGASDNPYTISNAAGLVELATNVNAGTTYAGSYFKLTDDIDLSSVCGEGVRNWTPIGTSSHPFKGVFDGDGKSISNLYININAPDKGYQGLFGYVEDAEINGVVLKSSSIVVLGNSSYYSAGICGYSLYSNFSDCINYANVIGNDVAGICAYIKGATDDLCEVKNCYNYGSVECRGKSYDAGGVLGVTQYAEVTLCVNEGKVSYAGEDSELSDGSLGGICSKANDIHIFNCTNKGDVLGSMDKGPEFAGGIVGDFNSYEVENVISGCKNFGSITGMLSGGISSLSDGYYSSCINKGIVTGQIAGGIAGMIEGSGIRAFTDCDNHGNVIGEQMAAGIVLTHGGGTITNCSNYGNISGKMGAAGIAGMVEDAPVIGCMNYGAVECDPGEITMQDLAEGYFTPAAGVVAVLQGSSTVSSSVNCGWVKNGHLTGGICGFIRGYENDAVGHPVVDKCMNFGPIEGNDVFGLVGGVVGNCSHSSPGLFSNGIQNCYNAGMVSAHGVSGGIAGYCEFDLTNCYNVGNVYSTDSELVNYGGRSGIVGILADDYDETLVPQVINCYYDKQMCTAEYMYYFSEDTEPEHLFNPTPVLPAEWQTLLTSSMIGAWNPLGDAFATAAGLYPQLTVFSASSNDLTKAASIVSVTPAFLANEENVDHVTRNFTVGTGNDVEWSHVSGNEVMSFSGANVTVSGTGTEIVAVSKDDISKCIQMTTEVSELCWAGSGTEADPYRIEDAAGLVCLAENVNAGESYAGVYFKMMNDIDLSSVCGSSLGSWVPIGDDFNGFKGEFDGNHKIISNLYINNSDDYNQGLFGYIKSASIKDVTVSGTVTASHSRAAGLVGLCETSEISGCVNNAIVSGYEGVGGIAGMAVSSNFSSCTNNGSISLTSQHAGGICGEFLYGSMTDCSNSGEISGPVGIGGLVGVLVPVFPIEQANGYMMSGCSNAATVTATVLAAGGVCGGIQFVESGSSVGVDDGKPYSILKDCTNSGAISCPMAVGGICGGALYPEDLPSGKSSWSSMSDWLVDGQSLLGSPAAFGVVEEMNENVLTNCTNTGKISGQNYVGGISGGLFSGGVISGCSNQGSVTAAGEMVGGVLGYANDHGNIKPQILNCSNFNNVTGKQNVAGIVGNIVDGSVSGCYNTGMISGGMFVGGVIGYGEGQTLTNSFNLGQIDGRIENAPATVAGGVIGGSYSGHVADCYNAGMVSGYGVAGGVAGVIQFHNEDFDYDGENLYNVGQVTCVPIYDVDLGEGPLDFNYRAGISILAYESIINNCYYDKQMCTAAEPTVQYSNSGGTAGGTATNCAAMLTSAMTSEDWIPGGSAFTASNGLYPQLTAFTASPATALDQAASIVSVTPAFLKNEENVEGVATSPFTVGTGNGESWSAVSPFIYASGVVSFSTEGTGTLTVSKTVSDITVSKDIQMTTVVDAVYWPEAVTLRPESYVDCEINTAEDLAWFASLVNGYNGQTANTFEGQIVHLNSDLDMSGYLWMPIGTCEHPFKGEFKGYDHTISGIKLDKPEGYSGAYGSGEGYSSQGLFGYVVDATISDLTIQDSKIEGYDAVGAFCGHASSTTFNNCHNKSNVSLVGSYSKASVTAGGICGSASQSEFIGCSNSGTVDGSTSTSSDNLDVAGICGSTNQGASFVSCHNDGTIIEGSGICDDPDGTTTVSNCYNTGTITGESSAGICGDMEGEISNCYNVGLIQGLYGAFGIAGGIDGTISNCFNTGDIVINEGSEFGNAAGICGDFEQSTSIASNCYNTGNVSGYGIAGGLFGVVSSVTIENCYNAGQVNCVPILMEVDEDVFEEFNFRGGIIGLYDSDPEHVSIITNCYYDKQMCTAPNAYYTFDEETGEFLGVHGADYQKLTTEMVGSALSSEYTDGWTFVGSGYTALYPQLTAFVESENDIDNEASLVSVRPMFLAETDNVDHVYTSPFTVGIDDDEEWSHVSGEELLTFNADGTVEWEDYGTETVAVTNMTHTFITKQIKLTTANAENVTWVDWVTEAPDGFDPANIDSPEDLAWFISYVNGFNGSDAHPSAYGEITADIDMSAHYWVPIGFSCGHIREGFYRPYGGSFEGNYHNIDGIRIKWEALKNSPVINALPTTGGKDGYRDNYDCIGMFGLMNGGSIRNLNLASATIEDDLEGEKAMTIGGIVGETRGTKIYSCVSNATITASRHQKIGGMVGEAKVYSSGVDDKNPASDRDDIVESVFDNCMSTASLTGLGEMGGIVGVAEGASLVSCYSYAQFLLAGDDTKDSGGATIGGLVGRSGRNYPSRLENCYVRMREDGKSELNKGGGSDFIVGLLIGSDNGGEVSYCYAPENTGFEYIGQASGGVPQFERATSIEDIFGTSKGDDYYIGLAVQESENSYYVADLVRSNGTIEVNSCSADVIGEKVVLQCYPEWEIMGDSDQGFVFNDGKYDMSCTSDGKLEFHYDMYSSYWDIESLTTTNGFSGFRITNKKYPYSLALYELDGAYVIGAVDYESNKDNPNYNFTFDIFAGRILPNLHGVGTYTPATYPYTYNDPKGGTVVTLDYPEDPEIPEEKRMVVSGETTLLDALNNWTLVDFYNKKITTDYGNEGTDWARFGSSLNGDYPIHCYYEPDNVKYGDVALPTAKVVSTPDKMNGIPFRYYSRVSDALAYYNAQAAGGIMGVYGSDDMRDAAVRSNDDNVDVYVNAVSYVNCPKAKEEPYDMITFFGDKALRCSNDWYVSLLQGSGSTLNVHSGFYLDNSDASGEVGGKAYDWHMVSSPLAHVPVGIAYAYETQQPYMTPADCSWDETKDGLFPTDTPLDRYDFYAYSEPDYHWINLKQNSASHYHQDGANEPIAYTNDTELTAGHGYLIAMDKEVFMQTSGTLNNGTVTVPVTYSGAHNKGLNFLGNPYMSSLDFDKFAEANETLWEGGAYAESYITLDADKKGYITYAKGQTENPEGLSRYVWPNQGFYIAAEAEGMASFTNDMRVIKMDKESYFRGEERPNYALVNLKATDSEGSRDMLTVELGRPEVGGARKVKDVENGNGILYSHYQGGDYSIVFTEEGISQVPVWFESREADSYTMTWSTYNGTFSYLHLIDNLTGCDVDMLTNSEYRFTSSTSDYASRFKLVFEYTGVEEDIDSDADGTFAFQMGEQIVVNGEGTLEIVDVQGRILRSERLSGVQSVVVPSVAKGLYLLRLSGSDSVKVQKIVIK